MTVSPNSVDDIFQTPERKRLAQLVSDFTEREIAPNLADWERAGELPRDLSLAAADVGLLGAQYPQDLGGGGGDLIDAMVIGENVIMAGGSGGVMAGLFTYGIAVPHVIDAIRARQAAGDAAGAQFLADTVVRPVLAGQKIAALGVTEPDGGSDVAHLRTTAVPDGDEWIINGNKTLITSGARADVIVVAARTSRPGATGVSLFAVDTATAGFNVVRRLDKMGWHCSDTAELAFVSCRVPARCLLTPEPGGGFASLARHFAVERLSLATTAYSTAERCLNLTLRWVRQRETFGRPLIARQVVRHTLVEMHRRTQVAKRYTRSIVPRPEAGLGSGQVEVLDAVLAKQTAVEACEYVVDRAVQLHGGAGYLRDSEVERHYRDARILGIGGGATEVMTDLAAKLLGW